MGACPFSFYKVLRGMLIFKGVEKVVKDTFSGFVKNLLEVIVAGFTPRVSHS